MESKLCRLKDEMKARPILTLHSFYETSSLVEPQRLATFGIHSLRSAVIGFTFVARRAGM